MGRDKAFVEVDGVPLWLQQLRILERVAPAELFLAGPPRDQWQDTGCTIIPDAQEDSGPLAGIVSALRRSSAPLLLALAVDLPNMTSQYLQSLIALCAADRGVVPRRDRWEPLAAIYPARSLQVAEQLLASGNYSLQHFADQCIAEQIVVEHRVSAAESFAFLNMNTPAEFAAVTA